MLRQLSPDFTAPLIYATLLLCRHDARPHRLYCSKPPIGLTDAHPQVAVIGAVADEVDLATARQHAEDEPRTASHAISYLVARGRARRTVMSLRTGMLGSDRSAIDPKRRVNGMSQET